MANNRPNLPTNPVEVIEFFTEVQSSIGDWVANGTPESGTIGSAIQSRYRDTCDSWSNGPVWVTDLTAPGRASFSNLCKPWLDSQGSGDPVNQTEDMEQPGSYDFSGDGGALMRWSSVPSAVIRTDCVSRYEIGSNGVIEVFNCSGIRIAATPLEFLEILSTGCCNGETNPYDPPSAPGPNPNPRPDPGLDPEDEPFSGPTGRPLVPMPPITDPFGEPVQLPNFPLPDIGGEGGLFSEGEPAPDPEGDPGEPATPVDIPEGEDAEETAPEGQELVGIKVEFTDTPGQPRKVGNVVGPDLFIGGAYVFLGVDGQGLQLQGEGSVIESGQFFFAARPSDKWRVIAALGYAVRVTPYYREVAE